MPWSALPWVSADTGSDALGAVVPAGVAEDTSGVTLSSVMLLGPKSDVEPRISCIRGVLTNYEFAVGLPGRILAFCSLASCLLPMEAPPALGPPPMLPSLVQLRPLSSA